jgi:hypothetical protein
MSRIVTCKICNKSMKCKQITKWQYTEKKRESQGYTIDSNGKKKYDYELVPYRHTNRRFIFPTHKKGLLFKKKCDGSNVKRVFEQIDRLYTQEEIDEIEDGRAQAQF